MIAKPRFRFCLNVFDCTGSLEVTVFGKEGDIIIGMSAQEFYNKTLQDGKPPIALVSHGLKDREVFMKIRSSLFTGRNAKESIVYSLLAMENVDKLAASAPPPTPSPKKYLAGTIASTDELEGTAKATKRKLDFGSPITAPAEDLVSAGPGTPVDVSSIGDGLIPRRLRKMGKNKIRGDSLAYEPSEWLLPSQLAEDRTKVDIPLLVKSEKVVDDEQKQKRKRFLHRVIIDDDDSGDDLNVGQKLHQDESHVEGAANNETKTKRSARGRIIKPKKLD